MNFFRSIFLMRAIVFLMASMVLFDSIDPPDGLHTTMKNDSTTNLTFVEAAGEHDVEDREGRVSGLTESNLYRNAIADIDFSSLSYIIVKLNSLNVISLFKSISSDLPSPPPKA